MTNNKRILNILEDEKYKGLINRDAHLLRNERGTEQSLSKELRDLYSTCVLEYEFIEQLSPFKKNFTTELTGMSKMFNQFYLEQDFHYLTKSAKQELCEVGIESMMNSIRERNKALLTRSILLEDDYLENRLHHLIEYGEEAIEFKNKDMDYLLEQIEILLREMNKHFFKIEEEKALDGLNKDVCSELFMGYLIRCSEYFPNVATGHVIDIGDYYLERIHTLTDNEIKDYKKLKVCPISYGLNNNMITKFKIRKMGIISENLEGIKYIVEEHSFNDIIESFIATSEKILEEINAGKKLYEIFLGEADYGNYLMKILETLPKLEKNIYNEKQAN
ncbi:MULTISPECIES: hypothetical protein [Bacillus cereus group]|uniref:hypothetical protein n=1 Tax=Bacillus cereus group TaxID=86661 RepID=UPI0022E5B65B|nr:hypothetical protein [Bacillus cereus group sp. TH152-1LC]MDA1675078.1 hypothetical protein [Bacillus cereus group sp. TH152-1LC]